MTRWSLRARVTSVAVLAVAGVLLLAAVLLLHAVRVGVADRVDSQLRADARVIGARSLDGRRVPPGATRGRIVQVLDPEGAVVEASEAAGGDGAIPLLRPPLPDLAEGEVAFRSVEDPALGSLRVLVAPFGDDGEVLVVARSDELAAGAVRTVRRAVLLGVPVLAAGLGAVVWVGVGRALRPVDDVRSTVAEISAQHLSRRVPVRGAGDEVDRLAATMNEMLDRLDGAAHRERRLVADASHELRSPIAAVRALLETRAGATDPSAHDAEALAALDRLQALVEQLLVLAGQDAGGPMPSRPVDLDDLVVERARTLRATTSLDVDTTQVSGGQVVGGPEDLRRIVDNLVANAARHARHVVRLELGESAAGVTLVVADDGPGVPAAQRARVFERFTRLDEARRGDGGGAGLGLAIVAGAVARHGGTIALDDDPVLGGARFVVVLPVPPPDPPRTAGPPPPRRAT